MTGGKRSYIGTHRRSRKRNKSSPLVKTSPKTSKPLQKDSDSDCELIQEITEGECSTESGSDNECQSQLLLKTLVGITPPVSTSLTTNMQNPEHSQAAPGFGSEPGETQSIGQPQMINPILFSQSMNVPTPQQQPQLLTYQGPLQHPAMQPMPAMLGLSDQDVIRVAQLVKSMLHDEINQIVELKVSAVITALKTSKLGARGLMTSKLGVRGLRMRSLCSSQNMMTLISIPEECVCVFLVLQNQKMKMLIS